MDNTTLDPLLSKNGVQRVVREFRTSLIWGVLKMRFPPSSRMLSKSEV